MSDPLEKFRTGSSNNKKTTDPRVQEAIDYVNANGGDPKTACIKLLKKRGMEIPDDPMALAMKILNGN